MAVLTGAVAYAAPMAIVDHYSTRSYVTPRMWTVRAPLCGRCVAVIDCESTEMQLQRGGCIDRKRRFRDSTVADSESRDHGRAVICARTHRKTVFLPN